MTQKPRRICRKWIGMILSLLIYSLLSGGIGSVVILYAPAEMRRPEHIVLYATIITALVFTLIIKGFKLSEFVDEQRFLPLLAIIMVSLPMVYYQNRLNAVETVDLKGFIVMWIILVVGVWLSFVCGESAAFLLICLRVRQKRSPLSLRPMDFALLAPDFGAAPGECYECTVFNMDDAVRASNDAADFCRTHDQGERMSFLVGLCIEEIVCNIVRYGFNADKGSHSVDVRLVFRGGEGLIRIRDNCAHFDPLHYLELHNSEDHTAHMGIRLVMTSVKEASYLNSLGLNNLTLRL